MIKSSIGKLAGANMDIDLATLDDQIEWDQDQCPWNFDEDINLHRCAEKSISICPFFCGVKYLDIVLCSYPNPNPYLRLKTGLRELNVEGPTLGKSAVCVPIIRDLPEWFGIETANQQYLEDIDCMPTFLARFENSVVGFLTVKEYKAFAAEIHIMGVRPAFHRQGIGRSLVQACEEYLKYRDIGLLQVKTLSGSHSDENYDKTRAFYGSMGFTPLEEFKSLWGEENPCLQMIKCL